MLFVLLLIAHLTIPLTKKIYTKHFSETSIIKKPVFLQKAAFFNNVYQNKPFDVKLEKILIISELEIPYKKVPILRFKFKFSDLKRSGRVSVRVLRLDLDNFS